MDKLWIGVKLWYFAVGGNENVLGNFRFGTLSEKFFTFTRSYVINYQLHIFLYSILFVLVEETAVPGENHQPAVGH